MDDIQDFVKQYWPYILGGVIALILITRMGRGNDNAGFYASQAAAGAQYAQANAAAQIAREENQLRQAMAEREFSLRERELEMTGTIGAMAAQAEMARATGESAAQLVASMYLPQAVALESAAYENAYALEAAANIAVASFQSQTSMVNAAHESVRAVSDGLRSVSDAAQIATQRPSPLQTIMGGAVGLAGAFTTNPFTNYGRLNRGIA